MEQPPCLVMAYAAGGALDDAVRGGRSRSRSPSPSRSRSPSRSPYPDLIQIARYTVSRSDLCLYPVSRSLVRGALTLALALALTVILTLTLTLTLTPTPTPVLALPLIPTLALTLTLPGPNQVREGRFASNTAVTTLLAGVARGMEAVHAHTNPNPDPDANPNPKPGPKPDPDPNPNPNQAVHAHKIIHLDLKPENILLSADNVPWVTDFGLSTSANLNSQSTSSAGGRGTIYFKACAPRSPAAPQHARAWEACSSHHA